MTFVHTVDTHVGPTRCRSDSDPSWVCAEGIPRSDSMRPVTRTSLRVPRRDYGWSCGAHESCVCLSCSHVYFFVEMHARVVCLHPHPLAVLTVAPPRRTRHVTYLPLGVDVAGPADDGAYISVCATAARHTSSRLRTRVVQKLCATGSRAMYPNEFTRRVRQQSAPGARSESQGSSASRSRELSTDARSVPSTSSMRIPDYERSALRNEVPSTPRKAKAKHSSMQGDRYVVPLTQLYPQPRRI